MPSVRSYVPRARPFTAFPRRWRGRSRSSGIVPQCRCSHTLGLVKSEVMDEASTRERIDIEIAREAVQKSAAVIAASKIELDELRRL